jgi:hyperosmotically inducible protein
MKKTTVLLLGGALALSLSACGASKTSSEAPNTTTDNSSPNISQPTAQTNQNDATNETRRKQLNADIRSAEQRNNVAGDKSVKSDNDIKSEVRSKLEANLPASALAISSKDGAVIVMGTVVNEAQLQKIEPLAKQIGGVKSVAIKATVNSAAKPATPKPGTANVMKDQQTGNK